MEEKRPIIWALYDDGFGSWNKLGHNNIYSIGINDNDWPNYFKVDLSLNNPNLINDLLRIQKITGKPDVIIAHPPCESWSIADHQRRAFRSIENIDGHIEIKIFSKEKFKELNLKEELKNTPFLKRDFFKQTSRFLIGLSTACAVDYIINYFKCSFIIENPAKSKIWDYFKNVAFRETYDRLYLNQAYYSNWDENRSLKPTIFLSDIDLKYPQEKRLYKPNKKTLSFGRSGTITANYDEKSAVPKELLKHIYNEILRRL